MVILSRLIMQRGAQGGKVLKTRGPILLKTDRKFAVPGDGGRSPPLVGDSQGTASRGYAEAATV